MFFAANYTVSVVIATVDHRLVASIAAGELAHLRSAVCRVAADLTDRWSSGWSSAGPGVAFNCCHVVCDASD